MFEQVTTNSHPPSFTRRCALIALLGLLLISLACKSDSSVASNSGAVTNSASSSTPQPVASPLVAGSPVAAVSPAAVPTTPFGPTGQVTPTLPAQNGQKQNGKPSAPMAQPGGNMVNEGVITRSTAKPTPTQDADPFPARPTPTVVLQNGKIVQQWPAAADAASLTNPHKSEANAAAIGRELYMQKCVDCHGKRGEGNGWMSPSLKRDGKPLPPTNLASRMVQANSDGELFWKVTNGRSPMPAHRVRFDDSQRWYIVSFLRTLK